MTRAVELLIGTLLVAALLWFARGVWHLTRFYWYRLRIRRECAPIDRISLEAIARMERKR